MGQSSQPRRPKKPTSSNTQKRGDTNKKQQQQPPTRKSTNQTQKPAEEEANNQLDLSKPIPLSLQQLLLDVFKSALLPNDNNPDNTGHNNHQHQLDIKPLIQTIKSHLYNRDFDSAFTGANEELLRAYALRWSASRALGYVSVFKGVGKLLGFSSLGHGGSTSGVGDNDTSSKTGAVGKANQVVCIGGGAGAEIVALGAVWRDMMDELGELGVSSSSSQSQQQPENDKSDEPDLTAVSEGISSVSLQEEGGVRKPEQEQAGCIPSITIKAVDIADWSAVVDRISGTLKSPAVPSSKAHPAPLVPIEASAGFKVDFTLADVLSMNDDELGRLIHGDTEHDSNLEKRQQQPPPRPRTTLITLMFTLNELFSTSLAKATSFLLRTTDMVNPGTVLLVLDSPGSYSTLALGGSKQQQRQYPMKFLLDHTLLTVAKGKWERVFSQDSRWWRRDVEGLRYEVGEGVRLEDMRFQVHVYRRLKGD